MAGRDLRPGGRRPARVRPDARGEACGGYHGHSSPRGTESEPTMNGNQSVQAADISQQKWAPRASLSQYYTTDILAEDDQKPLPFLPRRLEQTNRRFRRALEFG